MVQWKKVRIQDIGTVVGGATPSTKIDANYKNGHISWITPKDLSTFEGRYIYTGERNITEMGLNSSSTVLMPKNSILFSSRAPIGYVAIAGKELCTNQGFKSVIPNKKIDYLFLYYLLKYNKNKIENLGSGTTFKEVSGSVMKNVEVMIPEDIKEQKRIAAVLNSIDDKIELNNEINDNLLNQIDGHFRELYIDFEQNNGRIPDNFRYGILDELSKEIICGKTPSTKNESYYGGDIPFITIPDMHDKVYVIKTERYLSEEGANSQIKKFLPRNSICVSCIGTAGLVALVNESSHTNQQINSIIPKENVSPYYVYSLMKTLKDKIISLGQCGSTIVNLNKVQFSKLEVLIPTEQSMSEFDQRVKPMFEQINLLQLENEKLSSLRDSLLPKLMSGEIDVDSIEL